MKKCLLLFVVVAGFAANAQVKSTGNFDLISGMSAEVAMDNSTSIVTITLNGPSDRWFGLSFKNEFPFDDQIGGKSGMAEGNDLIYYNGTTLIDAHMVGIGETPITDAVNNWTVTANTVSDGIRTLTATRAFDTADANDYIFDFALTDMDFAAARKSTASYVFSGHGGSKGMFPDVPFTTLGLNDISLNGTVLYPNPSNGKFTIKSDGTLHKISIYTNTGNLVKSLLMEKNESEELVISGLSSGIYLIQLENDTQKLWKKMIVE